MNRFFILLILCIVTMGATAAGEVAQAADVAPPSGANAAKASSSCGAAQTTMITPNSQTVAVSLSNPNNAIMIVFRTGNVTYWTVMLSTSVIDVVLSSNRGNAVVTFRKGLALHLTANGSVGFNVFMSGDIVDDQTKYSITGAYLGTFTC